MRKQIGIVIFVGALISSLLVVSHGVSASVSKSARLNSDVVAYTRGYDANGDGIFLGGSAEEEATDIYMQTIGQSNAVMVNNPNSVADITPSFSPDGTKIAWASKDNSNGSLDILVKDLTTGAITNLTNTGGKTNERWPNWSNDGSMIVYNRRDGNNNLDVWVMNSDGTNPRYVAGSKGPGKFYEDCCASFTPDDKAVVFASNRTGDFNVYRYLLGGKVGVEVPTRLKMLTDNKLYEGTPSVEPSGTIIYRMGGKIQQIYRSAPFGARQSQIYIPGGIRTPESSPDGTKLIFGWYPTDGAQLDIAMTDSSGLNFVNVTNTSGYSETDPSWKPL